MSIYVLRKASSDGAVALARAIGGIKVRKLPRRLIRQDIIICWGSSVEDAPCRVLNGAPLRNKLTDARILHSAGIPTIEVSTVPIEGYVGRTIDHTGGLDLLNPPARPDFWVKRELLVKEYRVHSFNGVSARAGIKIPRSGFSTPHDWVRSWDGGWRISYDGKSVKQRHRDLAHSAIAALGLQFGAVDIGQRKDKSLVVLEVNRAPGLEAGTIDVYADAFRKWRDNADQ